MYLPYIAQSVLKSALISAPLKGILMGNAWFDPAIQYPAYLQYAYHTGILTKGSKKASKAEELDKRCNATLHSDEGKDKVLVPSCEALVGAVLPDPKECAFVTCSIIIRLRSFINVYRVDGQSMCLSSYDIHELTPCNAEYPSQVTRVRPYLSVSVVYFPGPGRSLAIARMKQLVNFIVPGAGRQASIPCIGKTRIMGPMQRHDRAVRPSLATFIANRVTNTVSGKCGVRPPSPLSNYCHPSWNN